MRLLNVETYKLEEFLGGTVPPYAILSHTWGNDSDEVSFRDVEDAKIEKAGIRPIKFEGCCTQVKKDGLRYAWIDTCCIDKINSVELGEAINSMFQWYKNAAICYAYLSDIPARDDPWNPGSKFFSSRWFYRGWTLQELLAPKNVCFYNSEWSYLGTKREMAVIIEKITGIPRVFLVGTAELRDASLAQRMSWAAKRVTKREEDAAYCLLGIFGVAISMIYGEGGDQAFSRLQQEIMRDGRDDSILAWGLNLMKATPRDSIEVVSGGVLAAAPSDFVDCGHIISREQYSYGNSFHIFGGSLRIQLTLFTTSAGETFGLLRCGPSHSTEQVVGIPLKVAMPMGPPDQYIRPQGHPSILLPNATSEVSTKFIHIQKDRQSRTAAAMNRQHWFYVEHSLETNVELIDVEPRTRWRKDDHMIVTTTESDGNAIQRTWTRFRHREEGSRDFVVLLEFEVQGSQMQARCHVMISSRDTALEILAHKFIYMRQEAHGKQSASNGILNLCVTLKEEAVAGQLMFVARLAAMPIPPETTVDATAELQLLHLKLELVSILQNKDKIRLEAKDLSRQKERTMANLEPMKRQLEVVEEKLKNLNDERALLLDGIKRGSQGIDQLTTRSQEIERRRDELSEQRSQTQRQLDDLLKSGYVAKEVPEHRYEAVVKLLLSTGVDTDLTDNRTPLSWASENGYETIVTLLLGTSKVDVDLKDSEGLTPLLYAVENGHEAVVELLLKNGAQLESKDIRGRTPLICAAANGHEAIVELLLKNDADLESEDTESQTPLSHAAGEGHETVVELLLKKGAKLECKGGKYNWTPLIYAAKNANKAVAELLLNAGAKLEFKDTDGQTPLSIAAANAHKAIVELLLDAGAELESRDTDGQTPLMRAAKTRNEALVELLLKKGAQLESKNNKGRTPLMYTAGYGIKTVAELLLENGAELESKDGDGQTPLMYAAMNGHKTVVELLLRRGAMLESKDNKYGWTPLIHAAGSAHKVVVEQLLKAGAKLEHKDTDGQSSLSCAAENGHLAVVALLLKEGAEVESEDKHGLTPLMFAAVTGQKAVVELLLKKGAKLESTTIHGMTPLMCAAVEGREAEVRLLLKAGAELKSKDMDGQTALIQAAAHAHKATVELLLKEGAELECKDADGQTSLSAAAAKGHKGVVELLLKSGAELESKDNSGQTPLMYAVQNTHKEVVELLLKAGAAVEATDSKGRTPLALADFKKDKAMMELLLKNGARPIPRDSNRPITQSKVVAATTPVDQVQVMGSAEPKSKDNNRLSPRWFRKKIRRDR